MSITLADIAQKAKVSPMTASRALRGIGRVNQQTREHVLSVAKELGYYRVQGAVLPPRIRKGTAEHSLKVLLPIFCDQTNPAQASQIANSLFKAIKTYLEQSNGQWLVECFCDIDDLISRWDKLKPHGIVLRQPLPRLWVKKMTELVPVVYVSPHDVYENVDAVIPNEIRSTSLIKNYLNDHGHQDIAWVAIKDNHAQDLGMQKIIAHEDPFLQRAATTHADKLAAWWMLMGLDEKQHPQNMIILPRDWRFDDLHQMADKLLDRILALTPRPTAIVSSSDALASAIIDQAKLRNIHIPKDFSIMTYGSLPTEELGEQPLTCIAMSKFDFGSAIAELIERRRANPQALAVSMQFQGTIAKGKTVRNINT